MKILGLQIQRVEKSLNPVYSSSGNWWGPIREAFAGAWQKNIEVCGPKEILAFSAVYASVDLIASSISTLRPKLMQQTGNILTEVASGSPFLKVLQKPNRYQTWQQFSAQWKTVQKLSGNSYIYKERQDQRGLVTALYVLDSQRVKPLIGDDGSVFYQIQGDNIQGLEGQNITVPASEIIHDRCMTPWHPLVGVSPIYACGASASQGIQIQKNSRQFFGNASMPSGILTVPGTVNKDQAKQFKDDWQNNYSGGDKGKIAILGGGMAFNPLAIPAQDAQLIEQLKWTVEDVARCFHIPLYKLQTGQQPTYNNVGAMNQQFYDETLKSDINSIEDLLTEGLELPNGLTVELDLEGLLRMDPLSRADFYKKSGQWLSPNEIRQKENYSAVPGGEYPLAQQQYHSLEAIGALDDNIINPPPAPVQAPVPAALAAPNESNDDPPDEPLNRELLDSVLRKYLQ